MKIKGTVKDGKFIPFAQAFYCAALKKLEGKNVTIEVKEIKFSRSLEQNKYYWKILTFIENETGSAKENLHEFFKHSFLYQEHIVFNQKFKASSSTAKLNTKEMTNYIEKIRVSMAEFGLYIPTPSDFEYIDF